MERINKWLATFNQRSWLKLSIRCCRQVVLYSSKVPYVEFINMAMLAEELLPKLEKELEGLSGGKSYYKNR